MERFLLSFFNIGLQLFHLLVGVEVFIGMTPHSEILNVIRILSVLNPDNISEVRRQVVWVEVEVLPDDCFSSLSHVHYSFLHPQVIGKGVSGADESDGSGVCLPHQSDVVNRVQVWLNALEVFPIEVIRKSLFLQDMFSFNLEVKVWFSPSFFVLFKGWDF